MRSLPAAILLLCLAMSSTLYGGLFLETEALFIRAKGTPQEESVTFTVNNPSIPYIIKVQNGPDGYSRISSATVSFLLNTTQIFTSGDFNQQVGWLEKPITVAANNTLRVQLNSKPGAALRIWIYGDDATAPQFAITAPVKNSVSAQSRPAVACTFTDDASGCVTNSFAATINGISVSSYFTVTAHAASVAAGVLPALPDGQATLVASINDSAGNRSADTVRFTVNTHAPLVTITKPQNGSFSNQREIEVGWTVDGVPQTQQTTATLVEGTNTIIRSATDAAGNIGTASVTVTLDTQPPHVVITNPPDGFVTNQHEITIVWTVNDTVQDTLTHATLTEGSNTIVRSATDAAGNTGTASVTVTLDTQPPHVVITNPPNDFVTNQREITVVWTVNDTVQDSLTHATLTEGTNTIIRSATDAAGNRGIDSIYVILDTQPPVVAIKNPPKGFVTNQHEITIVWTVNDTVQDTLTHATLTEGTNTITRSATDAAGNIGTASVTVTLDIQPPLVVITKPENGSFTNQREIEVGWTVDSIPQTQQTTATLVEGTNTIKRFITDAAGNTGIDSITVTLDTKAPVVEITNPTDGFVTGNSKVSVAWKVDNVPQMTDTTQSLVIGNNSIIRSATDAAGNTGTAMIHVTRTAGCVQINTTLTIASGDATYDGRSLCITNSNVTINGFHAFDSVTLMNSTVIVDTGFSASVVSLKTNSMLTHLKTTTDRVYSLKLIADQVYIDATSKIDANGRGYVGDRYINGAWRGARTAGNALANISSTNNSIIQAGGHGGRGGRYGTTIPSNVYDAAFAPLLPGGGGGANLSSLIAYGGDGGGSICITTRSLTLNGLITANGAGGNGDNYGNGAGGSIWVVADSITGSGSLTANGNGNTPSYTEGGGGGRVFVDVKDKFTLPLKNCSTLGGDATYQGHNGTTVIRFGRGATGRDLFVVNSSHTTGFAVDATIETADLFCDGGALYVWNSGLRINGSRNYRSITLTGGEVVAESLLIQTATVLDSNSRMTFGRSSGTTAQLLTGVLNTTTLQVKNSSSVTHKKTTVDTAYGLTIISETIVIDATGKIDVTGLGYLGDRYINGAWRGARTAGNALANISGTNNATIQAGGHGGRGGKFGTTVPSNVYDAAFAPLLPGGGGGANLSSLIAYGGDGGGSICITTRSLTLNGLISANGTGGNGDNYGNGAGGSIWIVADTITGSGSLTANGNGNTPSNTEGGGGGRVFVDVKDKFILPLKNCSTLGGDATYQGHNGTTVIRTGRTATARNLYIVNPSRAVGFAVDAAIEKGDTLCDNGTVQVWNAGLRISGGHRYQSISMTGGEMAADSLGVSATMVLDSTSKLTLGNSNLNQNGVAAGELQIKALQIRTGSIITHKKTTVDTVYGLKIVADTVRIDATSKIDVTGLGYLGDRYVNGAWRGARTLGNATAQISGANNAKVCGGTYGGRGGYYTGAGGTLPVSTYGSDLNPRDAGSGGGVIRGSITYYGGDGGGIIEIRSKALTLDGTVCANGAAGSGNNNGDGAGGSVLITADAIKGAGKIQSNGGSAYQSYTGGGGRISLYSCSIDSAVAVNRSASGYEAGTLRVNCAALAPNVVITAPVDGYQTNQRVVAVAWKVNGVAQNSRTTDTLSYGRNTIIRTYVDLKGYTGADTIFVTYDTIKPVIKIYQPIDSSLVHNSAVPVCWTADAVPQPVDTAFNLVAGTNIIRRTFTDSAGNTGADSVRIFYERGLSHVKIQSPHNGDTVHYSPVNVQWTFNDTVQTSSGLLEFLCEGENRIIRRYKSTNGYTAYDSVTIYYQPYKVDLQPIDLNIAGAVTNEEDLSISGTVDVTIANRGTDSVSTPFGIAVFEDRNYNQVFDAATDTVLGTVKVNGIGRVSSLTKSVPVSGKVLYVNNLLYVMVDYTDTVKEYREFNNVINNQSQCVNETDTLMQPAPAVKWEWNGGTLLPTSAWVEGTPVVAQLNDDNGDGKINGQDFADIICLSNVDSWKTDPAHSRSYLRGINGKSGEDLFVCSALTPGGALNDSIYPVAASNIVVGDIDNDSLVEIVILQRIGLSRGRIAAIENTGEVKWYSQVFDRVETDFDIQITDVEGDGVPEIVSGTTVLDNTGKIKWALKYYINLEKTIGFNTLICDLNLDGKKEIITVGGAYNYKGDKLWQGIDTTTNWRYAIGNFNDDMYPEIVWVSTNTASSTNLSLLRNDGSVIWGTINIVPEDYYQRDATHPCVVETPAVLDVDGDGHPEIALTVFNEVRVYNGNGTLRWKKKININLGGYNTFATTDGRLSSVSAFDYRNDGNMDVLFQDIDTLYVFDGSTGEILYKDYLKNSGSSTSLPVIADIDNDNSSEIITTGSRYVYGSEVPTPGIRVYEDKNGIWPNARKIWNQAFYAKTNVNDDGTIPARPEPSWLTNNTYQENKIDKQFGCMDLNASFLRLENPVAQDTLKIIARIGCKGSLNAPPDLNVAFYDETATGRKLLGKVVVARCLQPGEYIDTGIIITDKTLKGEHHVTVVADDDGTGLGRVREPDESDNAKSTVLFFYNNAPVIVADTMPHGDAYKPYSFQVHASDPDMHLVTYRLMIGEISYANDLGVHVKIDSLTGLVSAKVWPDTFALRVQVKDQYGAYALQDYTLIIDNKNNHPPVITSAPVQAAKVNVPYSYHVIATDPDDDPLFYSLKIDNDLQTPAVGMDMSPNTGIITWTPGEYFSARNQVVIVNVSDRRGGVATQQFAIKLNKENNNPPVFQSHPVSSCVQGQLITYKPVIIDYDADSVVYWLDHGPSGMRVDEGGTFTFVPGQKHVGTQYFEIRATDSYDTVSQVCTLTVANVNDAPVIVSSPDTVLFQNRGYQYAVNATDEDNDPLHYELITSPPEMSMTSAGVVQWNSAASVGTTANVAIRVTDPFGATATQSWSIAIVADAVKPVVQLEAQPMAAAPGETVTIAVFAHDNVAVANVGLLVDNVPVVLDAEQRYLLTSSSEDTLHLAAFATDVNGNSDTVYSTVIVSTAVDNSKPSVTLSATPEHPMVGDAIVFTVTATDAALDRERVWLTIDGEYHKIDAAGQYVWHALKRGTYTALATAYDSAGNYGSATVPLTVAINGSDTVPPTVQISSPENDTVIMKQAVITGTAEDTAFAYYTLSYRAMGDSTFTEYARSEQQVHDGQLGVIDASLLDNGDYTIRCTAYDNYGNGSYSDISVRIEGQLKIGLFTIAFTDMQVQLPGISLGAVRTYDSRNKQNGDFGYGWRLDYSSIKLSENRPAGEDWELQPLSNGLVRMYGFRSSRKHTVSIAIPGGRTQLFDAVPEFFSMYYPTYGRMTYTPHPGTYGKLEQLDAAEFALQGGNLYDVNGNFQTPYNPDRYRLTFPDGTAYIIDQNRGGVTQVTDANGNSIDITDSGIHHSSGSDLTIVRDEQKRITSIADESGRTVRYSYDPHGNLARTIDPMGNVTRFKYAPNHYLTEIIDARGVRAARTEYDDNGRMVRQISPAGDTMQFTHDCADNRETTRDFNGNAVEYTYDDRGNVLTKTTFSRGTDGRPSVSTYTYDLRDNLLTTRNPDGTTRSSTWDASGNELTTTDERGNTTVRTYNTRGQVITDACGTDGRSSVSTYEYDPNGNMVQTIGPDGTITNSKTYTSNGNLLTEKDGMGNTTAYGYDPQGRMISRTDPLGRTTAYQLDSRGNTVAEIDADGDTTRYVFDLNDNQTKTVTPNGDTTKSTFNVFNKAATQTDARGNTIRFEYDLFGQLKRTVAPDGSFTQKSYDPQGNVLTTVDEAGRVTSFEYDHENRVVKTLFNDGSFTTTEYDNRGRRSASIDRNGNRTEYDYDAVGNNTIVRDALGHETVYEYDAVNRRTAMVDAQQHRTEYTYDVYDRLIRTTFHDGTFSTTDYDRAGHKIAETDQAGKRTAFAYDSVGNLRTVTDAMNHVTSYTYDKNNNRITQKDANNHTTTMTYDKMNRLTARTYPNRNHENFGYDANGNQIAKVDGQGDSTVYTYDSRNREVLRRFTNSGHVVRTVYTIDNKRDSVIDHRGVTRYQWGSCCGQLIRVDNPDGTFIRYEYDDNKNKTAMITPWSRTEYRYDALNRMDSVIAKNGDVTQYFYNVVGNQDSIAHANGTKVKYTFDNLNRLTSVVNSGPGGSAISSYAYELNDAGIRTAVTEHDGSRVTYGYDDLYRLTGETRAGTDAYSISYTYDNVGNRLSKNQNGIMTAYVYNSRDQLVSESNVNDSISNTYDLSGRLISKSDAAGTTTYTWQDEDRMVGVTTTAGTISYTYDADNARVAVDDGATVKNYLIDTRQTYEQVVTEYNSVSNPVVEYVLGLERIVQGREGSISTYITDGQGSVRQLTDTSGNVTDNYNYFAFGEQLSSTGSTENEFRYVGEQLDPNTQYYYLRARWMDPSVGRFTAVDPWNGDPLVPLSLHRYLYGASSPISFVDPSGEAIIPSIAGFLELLGTQTILMNQNKKETTIKVNTGKQGIKKLTCSWGKISVKQFVRGWQGHHPLQKSIGGDLKQDLVWLPMDTHQLYHTIFSVLVKTTGLGFGNTALEEWMAKFAADGAEKVTRIAVYNAAIAAAEFVDKLCKFTPPDDLSTYVSKEADTILKGN